MPILETRVRGDWLCDVYMQSAVAMPTYLLAFAVTDFDYVEAVSDGTYFNNSRKLVRIKILVHNYELHVIRNWIFTAS